MDPQNFTPIWTPQDFTDTVRALWHHGIRFDTETLAPVIDLKTRKQIG